MTALRVLVCFDGSDGSINAAKQACRLFPDAELTIVNVWSAPPVFAGGGSYGALGYGGAFVLPAEMEQQVADDLRRGAKDVAERGRAVVREAGRAADALTRESTGPIWRELLTVAGEIGADAIVAGSRGFGEVKALLLGSTSQALTHHGTVPVVVVPAPEQD